MAQVEIGNNMTCKDTHINDMPYLSEQGLRMKQELKTLSDQYHYRKLPKKVSKAQRTHYMEELNPFWRNGSFQCNEFRLTTHDGTVLATGVTERGFVCGDYGVFLEIDPQQMCMENVKVAPGQEYRINDPKYAGNVKYQWYTDTSGDGIKLYFQQKPVTYADYLPGKWYVSPYDVTIKIVREKEKDGYAEALRKLREVVNQNTEADWQTENIMNAIEQFEGQIRTDVRTKLSYSDPKNHAQDQLTSLLNLTAKELSLREMIRRAVLLERTRILESLKNSAVKMAEAKGNPWDASSHKYYKAVSIKRVEEVIDAPFMIEILMNELVRWDCEQTELDI